MECRQCSTPLERPGDYCLVCHTANTDIIVLDIGRERATVSCLLDEDIVAERTVTTRPETAEKRASTELRNFAGRIADEIQRKRPEEVHATGDRAVLREVRAALHYPFYRVADENPIEAVLERKGEPALEVVEKPLKAKLGGSHSTLIAGRAGKRVLETIAAHPHVKKIIPGPIDAGGSSARGGVRAKATRADTNGNVRLILRDGSSVQENRIVTTAGSRELGEHVRADLNEALKEAELQE